MFSGGDSSEGLNQLGGYGFVNQVAVTNAIAAGQNIDWAQLAQQWIQMRDTAGSKIKTVSNMNENKVFDEVYSVPDFEEKGEADMDMDDEEQQTDEKALQKGENNFPSASGLHHNAMNQPWFFCDGTSTHLVDSHSSSNNQWSTWSNRDDLQQNPAINSNNIRSINPTSHIPSLLKMNVPHPNETRILHDAPTHPENATNVMDSAKRKVLPAWIREGLEKMEREKQRQLEKEKQKKQSTNKWSDEDLDKTKDISNKSQAHAKSEEEYLDEESSDNESGIQNIKGNIRNEVKDVEENDFCSFSVGKTYEQKLADLMKIVRRTLTELLLETTNEEISRVAEETVKLFKLKASSAQVIPKSALSIITGKLGLAAYADSSSEENSDDEGQDSANKESYQSESDYNSEEELRNTIRTKRRAFAKISEEIEERVSSAAAREEEKLKYFSRKEEEAELENNRKKQENSLFIESTSPSYSGYNAKGYGKDFGEITETNIQNLNGKRQKDRNSRKERTTRFSDNKDKYVAFPAAASIIANINVTGTTASGSATTLPNTNQRPNIPCINGLLPNYTNAGMTNVLNAADVALEKVLKRKSSESPKKQSSGRHDRTRDYTPPHKRQRRSSSSKKSRSHSKSNSSTSSSSSSTTTTSSDSDSSFSSRTSHYSKYSHRSSTKHKSHSSSGKKYEKSHKDYKGRKNASSSHTKKDRGSHSRRNASSDSDNEYSRRRRHDSHYSRRYTSSKHGREHSRSLSRPSYSSSSNRRQ